MSTPKNLLDDGSIKMEGNLNFNRQSIINLKELLPQATGAGNIGRWDFRWNVFGNIINLQHFNIETVSTIITGGTSSQEGIALTHGVGIPPSNTNIAVQNYQSRIMFDDTGNIYFLFSDTPIGQRILEWDTSIIISQAGLSCSNIIDTNILSTNKIITCNIECADSGGLNIYGNTTFHSHVIFSDGLNGRNDYYDFITINNSRDRIGIFQTSPTSGLHLGKSSASPQKTINSNYTVTADDHTIFCNIVGANIALTIPDASTCPGRKYWIKDTPGVAHIDNTIITPLVGLIENAASYTLGASRGIVITNDGTNWMIVADF